MRPQVKRAQVLDLVEPYIQERLARREITSLTARNERSALRGFARVAGDRRVGQLSHDDIDQWLATLHRLAASSRRSDLSSVRSFCRWLVRRGYLKADPTLDVPVVRVARRLPRALPGDKVTRLLQSAPDIRGVLICLLMVQEGLRCIEVSNLEVGDIDFNQRMARIIGKSGHERMLPLSGETWSALQTYLHEHPATSGPLIRSYKREWKALQADTISGLVSAWMSEAGIKRYRRDGVSAHALRHTAATDMLRSGGHLRDVQQALGHAHLVTTETYLPLLVHGLKQTMGGRSYRQPTRSSAPPHT
jgi:site-specific recombinase XerD